MRTKRNYKSYDLTLLLLVIALAFYGVILIASATNFKQVGFSKLARNQLIWVISGIIIMISVSMIDFRFISKFYIFIYGFNILLLLAVLAYGFVTKKTVSRDFPFLGGSLMPSEFNKIFMIIFLSKYLSDNHKKINKPLFLLLVFALAGTPVLLIMLQPSLSASLVMVFILIIMLYATNISYKYVIFAIAILVPIAILLYLDINRENPIIIDKILFEHQLKRIRTFTNPTPSSDDIYQTRQALNAIGSGELSGKGLFNHITKVPDADNDFIFTIVGEEFGFIGSVITIITMFGVVIKCIINARKSELLLGKLICIGVGGMLFFQIFVNLAVNLDLIPNTGMAIPLISSGGSSMWVCMACIGLVLNVSMIKTKSMFED